MREFNGHPSLQPPSVYDILYEIKGQIGGIQNGQRMTLHAVEKAFDRIADLQDRVSRLEASGPGPTEERVTLLKWVSEVLPATREIIIVILLLAAGLGLSWAPPLGEVTQAMQAVRSSD
jgi:hypothetical protein